MIVTKEVKVGKVWISAGVNRSFGVGFSIDKYSFDIHFICFWFAIVW